MGIIKICCNKESIGKDAKRLTELLLATDDFEILEINHKITFEPYEEQETSILYKRYDPVKPESLESKKED